MILYTVACKIHANHTYMKLLWLAIVDITSSAGQSFVSITHLFGDIPTYTVNIQGSNQSLSLTPMPPPYAHPSFDLILLPNPYSVLQLQPDESIPQRYIDALTKSAANFSKEEKAKIKMLSITRTNEEVSIVEEVGGEGEIEGREGEGVWRCVRIRGPMAFG